MGRLASSGSIGNRRGWGTRRRLANRDHYRLVYPTPEICTREDLTALDAVKQKLSDFVVEEMRAEKSWYKAGNVDISVVSESIGKKIKPLSQFSSILREMKANNQVLLYVR